MAETLTIDSLSVRYGGVAALTDASVSIAPGELVGLIGPNGAGKTTFIDAATGFTPASGTVRLGDTELSRLGAAKRSRLGLARTWQQAELYDDLTVRENLAVAASPPGLLHALRDVVGVGTSEPPAVSMALELLDLEALADCATDELTQGQRKLVDVGRALACSPDVVLLDEPAAGLDTDESRTLGEHLRTMVTQGIGMLLVDHDMGLVMGVCDRIVVLEFGKVLAVGTPDEIRNDPRVVDAYLGQSGTSQDTGVMT
ncbi:ABC transporter ATP-binding protein [Streptomyces cylindrosporus]|uniref:ATP-binding cassette domain-containing protein n=1 Tax=Streptomyces cylindrosporus TaxID=2927583 RepID=A0ABS9Y2L0_9ACTN|nr:ATP-binding cassette domain-containing protein [Streptomyces cylindrosporus]MCI3270760.1 ATP-binding cassette domain-containing protein [Streptomyces cylindrosporus]